MSDSAASCDETMTNSLANLDRSRAYSRAHSGQGPAETASVAACTSDELWGKENSDANIASNAFLGVNVKAELGTLKGLDGEQVDETGTERFRAFDLESMSCQMISDNYRDTVEAYLVPIKHLERELRSPSRRN